MHSIKIRKVIVLLVSLYYRIGLWHRGDKPTEKETRIKLFYCIYHSLFFFSLAVGAINSEKIDESVFLAELSIGVAVVWVKLCLLVWNQNKILNLLGRVCVFSIRSDDDHKVFTYKLRAFVKFALFYATTVVVAGSLSTVILTFVGSEKKLFLQIGFPLDYKNNGIGFWIATLFLFTEAILSTFAMMFSIIVWYVLLICSLRYEVLGNELKNMGHISDKGDVKKTQKEMHDIYFKDLKALIDAHLHLRGLVSEVEEFFSNLFFVQFGTSGLCICGSTYCLAFDVGGSLLERLMYFLVFCYFIFDVFMITYFGNEILLSSNRLSYSLFESDWYNQPLSTEKCIITFGEYLKQPQELVIGKLYPLTLETFTRILNSAYSMFNILKSFQ